ncbi:MAG: alpha/beta hydrolase [Longimicrobiales bacterium]
MTARPRVRRRTPLVGMFALVTSLVLLAVAILAIIPAPTYNLWKLKILVTECGHFVAPVALLSLLFWRRSKLTRAAAVIAAIASCILLVPTINALHVLRSLPEPRPSVFRFIGSLYSGREIPVTPRRLMIRVPGAAVLPTDFYTARGRTKASGKAGPLIVVIHGGSWQGGDPAQLAPLNYRLAHEGYAVAAISYRFAPREKFPTQLSDVREQVSWLRANARELGFDPDRIVVMGRSAGGQLALLTAYADRDPFVIGTIAFYAPADLTWGYAHPSPPRVHPSQRLLREYVGGEPVTHARAYATASPITFADSASPPTLLVHGGSDELVSIEHSKRLANVLLRARNPARFVILPWATHGCDYIVRGPCYQISSIVVEGFLLRVAPISN